jgi:hypothetical protein
MTNAHTQDSFPEQGSDGIAIRAGDGFSLSIEQGQIRIDGGTKERGSRISES